MRSFFVTVENVAPTADLGNNGPVPEGSSATVSFSNQFDPSSVDTAAGFHYAYDFDNDGTFDLGDGSYGGSVAGSSQMVPPALTAEGPGSQTVRAWIIDKNGDHTEYFTNVEITNVDPTLINIHVDDTTIDEGQTATITMTVNDPGALDVFEVDVNWQDGPADTIPDLGLMNSSGTVGGTTYQWDAQSRELKVTHLYRDDNPTATMSDVYAVALTVHDDDSGQSGPYNVDITVNNVRPVLVVAVDQSVLEGHELDLAGMGAPALGLFIDNGKLDTHTATVNWGDGTGTQPADVLEINGSGAVLGKHTYADDGDYLVTVTVTDDDGGFDKQSFTVTVENVAPSLTGIDNVVVDEGQSFTLNEKGVGLFDPGFDNPNNPHAQPGGSTEEFAAYTVDWGDGNASDTLMIVGRASDVLDGPTTASFQHFNEMLMSMSHVYADNGDYMVTIRVADDDMGAFQDPLKFTKDMNGNDVGIAGKDFVDLSFVIHVKNVAPALTLPNGDLPAGGQIIVESQTISLVNLGVITDPGFDNPNNPFSQPGGSSETFRYWVDWNDDVTLNSADTSAATIDDVGGVGDLTDASFDGSHTYADNGTYQVHVRVADDDMGAYHDPQLFRDGTVGEDYVEMTFTIVVTNVAPSFAPQPDGSNFQGDDLNSQGITTIRVAFNDPGYDNPLNTLASNGGETVETFNHVIQWGDGTVDAIHPYSTGGTFTVTVTMTPSGGGSQQFTFDDFNSANPVLTLVSSQQLNDPAVVPQVVTYVVNWGDGHVETFQLSGLLNPGLPVGTNGLTTLGASARNSGNANTLTTGSAQVQHQYLGPPNPLHPTADIIITLSVYDDDGGSVTDFVAVSNPGIQNAGVAIDTTPDVPRLDLTQRPMTEVFVPDQGGLTQQLQIPDVRGGGGEVAATTERYLELRVVYPDGTESQGYRIKDEALMDLRKFFKTLPDGRYAIYLVRTENHSERLVIQVDVRRGRVIDVSDDSEGTRDRPPVGEEQTPAAVPLEQNPLLETGPGAKKQGDLETKRQGAIAESTDTDDRQVALLATALVAQPWSRRVDAALAEADDTAWKRLRRAGRRGRSTPQPLVPTSRMRTFANVDYNQN